MIRRIFLTLIAAGMPLVTVPAAADVPDRAEDVSPLPAGASAPDFTVRSPDGAEYRFEAGALDAPVLLIFYRGGWCPYCNTHLQELRTAVPKLRDAGVEVLFLSADRPELLYASLDEPDIDYTLLSDASMAAARAFGVAFRVDDRTVEKYLGFGIDLEAASGYDHHQLPVPSVYLVDRDGIVRFMHAEPDYKVRIDPETLLRAAGAR